MLNRLLGIFLFGVIVAVLVLNYKNILAFSQTHELQASAQKVVTAQQWDKAVQIYEDGLKRYPENADIANRLAWYYQQTNQAERAEKTYRHVLQKNPDNVNARIGLANLLKQDPTRINEAVDVFRVALRKDPENEVLLSQIGDLYETAAENPQETRESVRKDLYTQAAYYYQLSLKLEPQQFQTQFNLGVAQQNLKNLQPAVKSYCGALAIQPDNYQARYNLGMVLTDLNFLEEGYRQMDRAVEILSQEGEMKDAMRMAQLVQNVKNGVYYNPSKQGLGHSETPTFMEKGCFYRPGGNADNPPD